MKLLDNIQERTDNVPVSGKYDQNIKNTFTRIEKHPNWLYNKVKLGPTNKIYF